MHHMSREGQKPVTTKTPQNADLDVAREVVGFQMAQGFRGELDALLPTPLAGSSHKVALQVNHVTSPNPQRRHLRTLISHVNLYQNM